MKLIIYSNDDPKENEIIDAEVVELLPRDSRITYIPSKTDENKEYFNKFREWYNKLGYTHIEYFDLDREYNPNKEEGLFKSNAIYLSGGNTYYFLYLILKRNFKQKLINFVNKGGVLIGCSAGSKIMGINVSLSGDENISRVNPKESLGLINYEIVPHYNMYETYEDVEKKFEMTSRERNLIALRNGEGLIVWDDDKYIIGEPVMFFLGNKEILERF